jgi:hypothetical protein
MKKNLLLSAIVAAVVATLLQPSFLGAATRATVLRLGDLADVNVGAAQDGDSLVYDAATQTWHAQKVTGAQGPPGPQGAPGDPAFGFDYLCDLDYHSGTGGYVGGHVRFDTTNPFAASTVYLGNGTFFGQGDPNRWIHTWDEVKGRVKGYMTIRSTTNGLGWLIFRVVGVTDGSNYEAVEVEPLDMQMNPCSSDNNRVSMSFFLAGDSAS